MNVAKNFIRYALSIGAIELVPEGRRLKSGRISPYFFNSGLFNTGDSIGQLANAYVSVLNSLKVDVVFGPAYKGIPLVTAVSMSMWQKYGVNVGYAFNRKEVKDHGDGGIIVGSPLANKRVLIVDDVMTTGTSSSEAVDIIRTNGGSPIGCVIAFDRQERGKDEMFSAVQEFENNYDISVYPAAALTDLIAVLKDDEGLIPKGEEVLVKILEYREQYGV